MFYLFARAVAAPLLYLDPGSGSFLIQLLLGAGLGLAVGAKLYWSKIKQLFRGKNAVETTPPRDEVDEP